MAVLAEAISIVIRADRLLACFEDDWDAFVRTVPNGTLCTDRELVRVGFMAPDDVQRYVQTLESHGLRYIVDGVADDMVVVDQQRGPMVPCAWIEFGKVSLDGDTRRNVSACRLAGSDVAVVVMPEGWAFDGSISQQFGFVPSEHVDRVMAREGSTDGVERFRDRLTGRVFFVGRTPRKDG